MMVYIYGVSTMLGPLPASQAAASAGILAGALPVLFDICKANGVLLRA